SGDGTRSSVYYLASTDLGSARPRARALDDFDPLTSAAPAFDADQPTGGPWRGAGGRWLLWLLRVVLWAALLVVAFRGVTAIVFNQDSASSGAGPASAPAGQFPVPLAEAYAADFGRVYLNFSPQNQGQREQQLAAFVPARLAAADPDLGWNGVGQLSLQAEQVAGITVQDPRHAVVMLLALVNGQLMELGVPVTASGHEVVVSSQPAWLPAPAQVPLPAPAAGSSDPVARSQLMNELPAFFQAYGNGGSAGLSRFLAPGARLAGLGAAMAFDSIAGLHVPSGGSTRQITVGVIWQLLSQGAPSGAKLEVTYSMLVVQQSSVKWYVKQISASIEAVGAQ
ncbi:MAG: conjugal transfer protein, partial [Actinomycetota bacterium]|nr:conjugal transfer protein [Actinomycetota bacterium]